MMDMTMPVASSSVASGSGGASAAGAGTSGGNDFLAVLSALLPVPELDADAAATAVSEALAEFAHLGEEYAEDDLLPELLPDLFLVDRPIPALLARFSDPPVAEAEFQVPPPVGNGAVPVIAVPVTTTPVDVDALAASGISLPTDEVEVGDGARTTPPVDAVLDDAEVVAITPGARREAGRGLGRAEGRGRDVPPPGFGASVAAVSEGPSELIDGLRSVASAQAETSIRESGAARAASSRSDAASAASIQRVLDAVERSENAPPPRHLTLELADGRLRVAIEEGQIRLTLLGERGEDASRFLDDARAALEERGFDLSGNQGSDDQDDPREDPSAPRTRSRSSSPRVAAGLRL
jgi:hypothetical protein